MIHVVSQRPGIAHGFIETEVEALPGALRGFASCVTRIGQGGVAIARQQRVRRSSAGLARVKRSTDCRRRQGSPGASARPGLGTASRSSDGRTLAHAWQIPLKCPNPLRLADRSAPGGPTRLRKPGP